MNLYEKLIVGFKDYDNCPECEQGIIEFEIDYNNFNPDRGNFKYIGKCDRCDTEYIMKPVIWGLKENES